MLPRVNTIECNDANFLAFSTNDAITQCLLRTGTWEEHIKHISKFFLNELNKPLILDIGANMGAYSVPIAKHVQNSGGTVIAFEPQRIVFYQLCGNIIINRLDNVIALNHAVGEIDGFIEIPEIDYKYNHNIGAFSIEHDIRSRLGTQKYMKNESYNVKLISLDKFSVERSPSLIKLDVEGYELAVLKGGSSFLEEYNFPPILFESWNDEWFKNKKEELHKYILHLGYNITSIHGMDYVAQHPRNQIRVDFKNANGVVSMTRAQ